MKQDNIHIIKNLLVIAVAAFIYAAGISLFLDPNNLAPGGVTGISVILNRLVGVDTGTLYFLLNIPIVLLGVWKFGWHFMGKTTYAVVLTSTFTNLLSGCGAATDDPLLAALAGSVLIAFGIGLIFRAGATTGGTDIIIKILRQKYRYLKTGFLFQCTDMIIVAISGLVFRDLNIALYAMIAVLISGRALDYVLYGGDEAKLIYIITEKPDDIGKRLLWELEVGVTYLHGAGGWTGREKQVILCVVRRTVGPRVQELVKAEDPDAFLIITSASEIYGEGYKNLFEESL
ncbi:MAG: YitT family protein [Lachnospiraceae bacterium]|nr:YitT family protein [Lachnospiraceae bacterium]